MKLLINGEDVFRSSGSKMAISATENGYVLQYSVDGNVFNDYAEPIPANENLIISDVISGMFFKLAGNIQDGVTIRF